jgi:ATP-binding cassette subfamily F protein 3
MEADSPVGMVPMIRNILGGFLFTGDDIYKRAGVLSGGERTRLAVARMLLRPANTLLLDEPTNHLDLDSKDVLLEALEDFGGTLIFVSHDRYFVDKLATKVIAVGSGGVEIYPGTYEQFLWSRANRAAAAKAPVPTAKPAPRPVPKTSKTVENRPVPPAAATPSRAVGTKLPAPAENPRSATERYEDKKKSDADARRKKRSEDDRNRRIADLEARIGERERSIKEIEAQMSAPGFYEDRSVADSTVARHHQLMWEVGDLMHQWETLQEADPAD